MLPNNKEEKMDFLKREEIRTMQKDVSALREEEAAREREKIADLQAVKTPSLSAGETNISPININTDVPTAPKAARRGSGLLKKIIVRLVIVVLCFFILTFLFWLFAEKLNLLKKI